MFYEGLYLYQKTGVNTARTLYTVVLNIYMCTLWCRRSSLVSERGGEEVGEEPNHTIAGPINQSILSRVDTRRD
jgi:hypothetical protein